MILSAGASLAACTAVIDVDDYVFVDGGTETTPGLPLEPEDAGKPGPPRPPQPTSDAGDGSGDPDASEPPPVVGPSPSQLPRPVVVDAPAIPALVGSQTGGAPRSATCPGGVISGLVFQYFTSAATQPDRLSYVWPVCNRLVPGTPALASGEEFDAFWPLSEVTDPVFAPLRENEDINWLICPEGQHLVGIDGTYDEPVGPSVGFRSLGIRCAGLGTDLERSSVLHSGVSVASTSVAPAAGVVAFSQQCPDGRAGNQLDLRFGSWLDALGLSCSVVRWPFIAGHACASGEECQSGTCAGDGLCAP